MENNKPYKYVPYPDCPVYFEHKDATTSAVGISNLNIKGAEDYESE